VIHNWFPASGGGLLATMWLANPMKVALMKPTYSPNPDTHRVWTDIAGEELSAAGGYATGGLALTGKTQNYDAAQDRTNLLAADSSWGPGATFATRYAVVYDDSGAKPLWSLVDFEAVKDVDNGVFTIDWAAVGLLYVTKV
jgi:hypothetical protein